MKIVFLSPAAQMGGAEAVLVELLHGLREARPDWSLQVIAGENGPLLEKFRAMAVPCELLPFPMFMGTFGENRRRFAPPGDSGLPPRWWAKARRLAAWVRAAGDAALYVWRLRRRLRQLQPDIVHSNGMKMHLLGALARPRTAALVWHLHDYLSTRRAMLPLLRQVARRSRMVIANSGSVAADARRTLGAGLPVQTVYNAVDSEIFTPDGPSLDLDEIAGLPSSAPGTVRVGLVATFAFWKGHEIFLRAAAMLLANETPRPTPIRFYVIGGPVYATADSQWTLEELRDMADKLGIGDQVGFTGFVADVPGAMRALDIVVHASTEPEPFGLVIVQAMACGRVVVASAAGGAGELVAPETDALVHPPGDAAGLADAIRRLAADAGMRARLGQAGRVKVSREFSRARMAAGIVPLYESLIAARPR